MSRQTESTYHDMVQELVDRGPLFETEYDGRTEEYCFYCKVWFSGPVESEHDKNCAFVRMEKLLK